mgnify:CR=1 FL=1
MSNINTNATVTLTVNGRQAEDMLQKLRSQASNLEKAIDKAAKAGNKQQLTKLKRELKETNRQINQIESAAKGVEEVLKRLDEASPKELNKTLVQMKKNLNGLERGSEEWNRQCEAIKRVKAEIAKVNNELRDNESLWERMNRKLNDRQTALAAIVAAVTGIIMAGRAAVSAFADMDQEMANVRKFTGMNASEVKELNEEFKKINTRTAREDMNKLAQEAGRLGKTSKEDVLGFVRAADQINVALDDLGDGATLTLSKLTNIFGDEERLGTEKALLAVGSVINELSQNCTASAPYLANFAKRMAGVGAQAKMTIPEIMGFAAVLDSQGQAVEMSATAVSKVIMDMFKENDKIIKATGLNAKEFNETLKKSTNEGLLMLLDRLHELGNIDVLAPVFKDMGENGARAVQVISALAGNLDMVRWEQEVATKAFIEATSVTEEFNVQNNTVQAGLDKARKEVHEMAVELGDKLQPIMSHVISSTTLLLKFMSTSITFIKDNAFTLASLTAAFVAYKIAVNASNIAFKAHYAWLVICKTAAAAYRTTVATVRAAHILLQMGLAKLQGNWVRQSWLMADLKKQGAMLASGYGALIAVAILLGATLYKVYKRMTEVSQSEKDLQEIRKRGQEGIIEEKNKIDALLAVARDENKSLKDRHDAIDALNSIVPEYNGQLDDTTGKYKENKKALDEYIKSLTRKYEIEGAKDKLKEIGTERVTLELQKRQQEKIVEQDKKDAEREVFVSGPEGKTMAMSSAGLRNKHKGDLRNTNEKLAELDERKKAITDVYGEDIMKEELDNVKKEKTETQQTDFTRTTDDKKEKNEDVLKEEKDWRTREQALNRIAYAKGEKDFEEYTNRMTEIEMEYNQKVMANGKATTEQKMEAEAAYYEAKKKLTEDRNVQSAKEENDYYNELVATEKQRFIDGKVDQQTFNDALELMELEHLKRLAKVYTEGSKEQLQAQKNYQNKLVENQKRNQKTIEDNENKHQKELAKIKEDFFGDNKTEKKEKYDKESAALDEVFLQEIKAAGNDAKEKLRIEEAYQKAKVALAKKYGQEYNDTSKNFLENMTEDITEWLNSDLGQAVQGSFDTLTSGMSSIFSGMTSLIQAELEIQTAAIEKRYESEIRNAEGNNYIVKKLEDEKQKELAKKKNEANKKMFAMQVIQAVAQTAQNAISAYGSAAAIPLVGYILAPVAAAMAVAAGAIQIAAIKKQQQASESQGYVKGGFTPSGPKLKEVGVVHAGEWVASQEMLASPVARPIIEALDYAQRTNTIGSLRADDVSRTIAPVTYNTPQQQQRVIVQQKPDGLSAAAIVQNTKVMQEYKETMSALKDRLNEPFVTVNTVTGDSGIKQAQDEYNILIRNKTPKSRRK